MARRQSLTSEERAIYEWQLWISDLGVAGQEKLKSASVLITRVGGVGGQAAYQLAAAGIGKLILAHAGNIKSSDLNRQILMTHAEIGQPRMRSIVRRLKDLNPRLEIDACDENVSETNVARLVAGADIIVDCAPRFEERFLLNRESVLQQKPLIEAAMFELELSLTTFIPGQTPCLACLYPEIPPHWRREFPVLGAVAGTVGCLAAMEVIKLICGIGQPLCGRMLLMDLGDMSFRTVTLKRNPQCAVCKTV